MAFPRVHTGARAILKLDGNVSVFATSVSYSIDTEYKEIQTIDTSLAEELVPTRISVSVTCTNLRIPAESASVLALQPTILNHLHQGYISIEIVDRLTGETMLFVPKAMLIRRDGVIGTRGLAQETWTMTGIGYWDERPPEKAKESKGQTGTLGGLGFNG